MELLTTIWLCLSLIFSCLNPFLPLTAVLAVSNKSDTETEEVAETPETEVIEQLTQTVEEDGYKINNFIELDFEGYCTLGVPQSHFTVEKSSTNVFKTIKYKDNKTTLAMSYVTNISEGTDMPGYITIDVAGVDTVTNDKVEETYGDGKVWMKVPSKNKENGCNVYVWYIESNDKTSAFWVKAKVIQDSDNEEFYEVIRKMFDTFNKYQYGSGTLFETPDSGYYATIDTTDPTKGDSSDYEANDKANTVFETRGGYVPDADISPNWQDLEIIIDGTKFKLPCKMSNFYDAGFIINDMNLGDTKLGVVPSGRLPVRLINNKGTVIDVTVLNDSAKSVKHVDECQLVKIKVDRAEFVSMSNGQMFTNVDNTEDETITDETEQYSETESELKETEESESKQDESEASTEDGTENSTEEGTEEGTEEADDGWTNVLPEEYEEEFSRPDDPSMGAEVVENEEVTSITDGLEHDSDYKAHEIIIAGGVTWNVFTDDLIKYFGQNKELIRLNGGKEYEITWRSEEKIIKVVIGAIHTIKSVELSCDGYN